jgi:hypothetical protein
VGDIEAIVDGWGTYLGSARALGAGRSALPATRVEVGPDGHFRPAGLDRKPWRTAGPIRAVFREAFARADLPHFPPHSLRKTLVRLGQKLSKSPEEYKAWSQNL